MFLRLSVLLVLAVSVAAPQASATPPAPGTPDIPHLTLKSVFEALDGPVVPEAWTGIWDNEVQIKLCDTPIIISSDSYRDTLCVGDMVDPGEQEIPIECTGTATETSIDMTCTASAEVSPGCMLSMQVDYDGTRTGDSYTTHMVINSTYTGDCSGIQDSCLEADLTGTRVGPAPASCTTPVDRVTWGTIKSRYE